MFQINWKLKALLYKVFSIFGFTNFFYWIQKYITKRSRIKINEINKLWVFHSNSIEKYNVKNILEVGAGKSLAQNIYISYKFESLIKQTAVDINLMIDFDLVNEASSQISNILGKKNKGKIKNFNDLKTFYNIDYKAPCALESLKDINKKFDMCISTTALEHFTIDDLNKYLSDLKNVLTKDVLISSVVDYSDHYSHTDKNIGALNFLKYSEKNWEKYNNSYLFQNRLRHQDYIKIIEESGYKIREIFKGKILKAPNKISNEFESENEETYFVSAYFLFEKKVF